MTDCAIDGQPADGAVLCGHCSTRLWVRLGHVPSLLEELEVTITRQDRFSTSRVGGRGTETPMLANLRAVAVRDQLRDRLALWCRTVAEDMGYPVPFVQHVRDAAATAARWLLDHPGTVRHHVAAGDLYEELTEDIHAAFRAVDRPPDVLFAGRCECGELLYARRGHELATCRALDCGLSYSVQEKRDWMLQELEYFEASAADASRILGALGVRVPDATIRKWASRGKLTQLEGRRYRLGEIVEVAAA